MKSRDVLPWALLLGGAYGVYRLLRWLPNMTKGTPFEGTGAGGAVANVVDSVAFRLPSTFGAWAGKVVFNLTHADHSSAATLFVTFPGGVRGVVPSEKVNSAGMFVKDGLTYQLKKDEAGKYFAVRR